jgi:hypothetical protein
MYAISSTLSNKEFGFIINSVNNCSTQMDIWKRSYIELKPRSIVLQRLQIQRELNYRIAFPENKDFVSTDLRKDSSNDLERAES